MKNASKTTSHAKRWYHKVEVILELLSSGMTHAEILADYDDLEEDDIFAVLAY